LICIQYLCLLYIVQRRDRQNKGKITKICKAEIELKYLGLIIKITLIEFL